MSLYPERSCIEYQRTRNFLVKAFGVLGLKYGHYADFRRGKSPRYRVYIFDGSELFPRSCKLRRFLRYVT